MFVATHSGILVGDARTGDKQPRVRLRETKCFWITSHGTKFRKFNGWPAGGNAWPMWTLDIKSVILLDKPKTHDMIE